MSRRTVLWCAVLLGVGLALYLGAELLVAGRVGPSLDDGWIYMAFARSFLEGDAFSYPGHDGPVAAITGTIWSLLLAAVMAVVGATPWAVKVAGAGAAVFAIYGSWRLARAATGDPRTAAFVALIVACTPRVLWGALSGMEATFAVGATAFGLALHLERRTQSTARWLIAALALSVAGWARPECFVFVPIAALHRRRLDGLLLTLPLLAAYPLYNLAVFGYPLPTTFYAKAASGSPIAILRHDGVAAACVAIARNLALQLAGFAAWLPSFLPFLAPGLVLGVRRGLRERDGVPFLAAAVVLFAIARGGLGFQPPWFQQGRYFLQLWPPFLILAVHGFDLGRTRSGFAVAVLVACGLGAWAEPKLAGVLAFDWIPKVLDVGTARAEVGLIWVPAAATAAFAIAGAVIGRRGDGRLAAPPVWLVAVWMAAALGFGALRHGEGVRDTYELNVAMAEVVAREVPAGEVVACHDIGALGFFARRPLLDLAGLGSPEVAMSPRAPGARPDIAAIVQREKPRFICLTEDMADMVNPGANTLKGIRSIRLVASIHSDHNVTVQGDAYHLIELIWD